MDMKWNCSTVFPNSQVFCIFGLNGVHHSGKLVNVTIDNFKQYKDLILVTIPNPDSSTKLSFTLTGTHFNIVQRYAALRPAGAKDNRFFVHFRDGKCNLHNIGKNYFTRMARKIAKYLKLPEPDRYSGTFVTLKHKIGDDEEIIDFFFTPNF